MGHLGFSQLCSPCSQVRSPVSEETSRKKMRHQTKMFSDIVFIYNFVSSSMLSNIIIAFAGLKLIKRVSFECKKKSRFVFPISLDLLQSVIATSKSDWLVISLQLSYWLTLATSSSDWLVKTRQEHSLHISRARVSL